MNQTRDVLDCRAAEERFSDHLEGTLDEAARQELESHLASCPGCRGLRSALEEVVQALRNTPELEPANDLAHRAAAAALRAPVLPFAPRRRFQGLMDATGRFGTAEGLAAVRNVAAVLAVMTTTLLLAGQLVAGRPSRGRARIVERTVNAGVYLAERKDRLLEDFRILRVVIATAFEGRVDRMNDRMDDYRRLLERRREEQRPGSPSGAPGSSPGAVRPRGAEQHRRTVRTASHQNSAGPANVQQDGTRGDRVTRRDDAQDSPARSAL